MRSFPRHDSYKESGVEWIGEIPSHWHLLPLKRVLSRNDGGVWTDNQSDGGARVYRSTEINIDGRWNDNEPVALALSATDVQKATLEIGDLLVTKSSGSPEHIGKTALINQEQRGACYSNFMQRLRIRNGIPKFYFYFLNSFIARQQYQALTTSTSGLGNINATILGNILASILPLPEQTRIAAFLDEKTAEIDEAIAKKQRLIELLQEQKVILINRAVTRGLNPHVPLRESGVEWIGEIPSHWEVRRNRYIFAEQNNRSEKGEETHLSMSQKFGLIPAAELDFQTLQSESYEGAKLCLQGDLVLNRLKAHLAVFSVAPTDGLVSPDYSVFRLRDNSFNSRYFEYLFKTPIYLSEFNRKVRGIVIGFYRLYSDDFKAIPSIVPPAEEQHQIIEFITALNNETARVRTATEQEIEKLQEFKTVLISNAVTGKIKV